MQRRAFAGRPLHATASAGLSSTPHTNGAKSTLVDSTRERLTNQRGHGAHVECTTKEHAAL
jgi:hypothetical protein